MTRPLLMIIPHGEVRTHAMSESVRCPDCGYPNPPQSEICTACHFPLTEAEPQAAGPASAPPSTPSEPTRVPRRRPIRPRRPEQQSGLVLSLWLGVGAFCALLLVVIAIQANLERERPPVEGSSAQQQRQADALRAALERDSTDTRARVALADLLFDTGNWPEAIVHYRSAVNHDSSLVSAIVDLGVCYYNLSLPLEAERMFLLVLARDPRQPFALFNLGIVHERRGDTEKALEHFRRVMESGPPENMKPALAEAMRRVAPQSGRPTRPTSAPR